MNVEKYYNFIASFYDLVAILPYKKYRINAIEKLNLKNGDIVIDIGTGTGANLKMLSGKIGNSGVVYAIEPSIGMYNRAKQLISKHKLSNIVLLNLNTEEFIKNYQPLLQNNKVKIIATLVFSVMPYWEKTLEYLLNSLKKDSIIVIMDLYKKDKSIFSFILNKIAFSQIDREVWKKIKHLNNFELITQNICCYFGIKLYIATGKIN